jgi:hypothetical protein
LAIKIALSAGANARAHSLWFPVVHHPTNDLVAGIEQFPLPAALVS